MWQFQSCCADWKAIQALLDSKGRSNSKGNGSFVAGFYLICSLVLDTFTFHCADPGSNKKIHPTGQRAYSVGSDTGTLQKRVSQDTPPM
jgi:hypothetical protein